MAFKTTYGLLGFPVKHSLSPLMHNAAFQKLGIDAQYKLFEKKNEELESFLQSVSFENIAGFNVTVPHKEAIISFLDELSQEAKLIGAVNTVKIIDKRLLGHNTDGLGFIKHLSEVYGKKLLNKSVSLLGAGGAAKAVATMLAKEPVKKIRIYDIDKERLGNLVCNILNNFPGRDISAVNDADALLEEKPDLLVNATPVGMKEQDSLLINRGLLFSDTFVYDLIYNPPMTKLLQLAKDKGCGYSNGLGMLLYQGVLAFELWTGKNAPVECMRQALKQGHP